MDKPDNIYRILTPTGCPDQALLLDYLDGKTSAEVTRSIELHLADCPLCSDAVEGLSLMSDRKELDTILKDAKSHLFDKENVFQLPVKEVKKGKSRQLQTGIYIGIAASLALIITSYFGVRFLAMSDIQHKETISMETAPEETPKSKEIVVSGPKNEDVTESKNNTDNNESTVVKQLGGENDNGMFSTNVTRVADAEEQKVIVDGTKDFRPDMDYSGDIESIFEVPIEREKDEVTKLESKDSKEPNVVTEESAGDVVTVTTIGGAKRAEKKDIDNRDKNAMPAATGAGQSAVVDQMESKSQEDLNKGLDAYNKGDYPGAVNQFKQTLDGIPNQTQALYYNGMSYYYLKNYEEALKAFNTLLKDKKNQYYQAAQWQIAVIYLETSNNKQARKTLNEIIDGNGSYRFPAEEAIKNIGGN